MQGQQIPPLFSQSSVESQILSHGKYASKLLKDIRDAVREDYLGRCRTFAGKIVGRAKKTATDIREGGKGMW